MRPNRFALTALALVTFALDACAASSSDDGGPATSDDNNLTSDSLADTLLATDLVTIAYDAAGPSSTTRRCVVNVDHPPAPGWLVRDCSTNLDRTRSAAGDVWSFDRNADGAYRFTNLATGRCLRVGDAASVDQAACAEEPAQRWNLARTSATNVQLRSALDGRCLSGPDSDHGTAQVDACGSGRAGQVFTIATAPRLRLVVGIPSFLSQCIDVPGATNDDGARLQQWACHLGANQQWFMVTRPDGVELRSRSSGECMTVDHGGLLDGTPLVQSACNGGSSQRFHVPDEGQVLEVSISSASVPKCLARVGDGEQPNGAPIQLEGCTTKANQHFNLKRVY